MTPHFAPALSVQARADDYPRDHVAQSKRVQLAAELVIVGEVIGDCGKAADAVQVGSAKRQSGAQTELGNSNEWRNQRAWCEVCGHPKGFPSARPGVAFGSVE